MAGLVPAICVFDSRSHGAGFANRTARLLRAAQGTPAAAAAGGAVRDIAAKTCARSRQAGAGRSAHLVRARRRCAPRNRLRRRRASHRAGQAPSGDGFIGSDGYLNAIAKALAAIDEDNLGNIRLHHGDASALIDWLPAASLARIDLLYPDPWPKRRHWKRRFVQDESLARLARILRSGGELRFATDIPGYAAWTLARVLRSNDFVWTAETRPTGASPGPTFPARATRPRPSAKAARPPISSSAGNRFRRQ